ncbi:MAG: transposase, partial [Corynebacterium sp.]|nr:transposase [Corynebacterium sp.]
MEDMESVMRGNSPEVIIKKLEEAKRLEILGKTKQEIARELGVSAVTLKKWRDKYEGMSVGSIQRVKELEAQLAEAHRLLGSKTVELEAAQLFIKNL